MLPVLPIAHCVFSSGHATVEARRMCQEACPGSYFPFV